MKKKAPMIIVSILFALIIISIIVFYILYTKTDLFKGDKEIFKTHFLEDVSIVDDMTDLSSEKQYLEALTQQNYKDNTNINVKYKNSKGNIEEFDLISEGVTNNQNNNSYRKVNAKFGQQNQENVNIEFLQENQTYGILFADAVKQFVSANIIDFNEFFKKISIDTTAIQKYEIAKKWDLLANQKQDIENICIDYLDQINSRQFTKIKDSNITLSTGQSQVTVAYKLILTSEQTKELYIKILEKIGNTQLINDINQTRRQFDETEIIIYVLDNRTSKIELKFEGRQIELEFLDNELKINYSTATTEELQSINIHLKKQEQKKYIAYKDSNQNKIVVELNDKKNLNNAVAEAKMIIQNQYIAGVNISFRQELQLSNSIIDIPKKFQDVQNINLSNLNSHEVNSALNSLLQRIDSKIKEKNKKINFEIFNLWLQQNKNLEDKYQGLKKKEISDFNNLFLSYNGENVDKNIIYNMLDLVSKNFDRFEKIGEDRIRIFIKQGVQNNEKVEELKKIIEESEENYNIKFKYDAEGKISRILMEKYKEEE